MGNPAPIHISFPAQSEIPFSQYFTEWLSTQFSQVMVVGEDELWQAVKQDGAKIKVFDSVSGQSFFLSVNKTAQTQQDFFAQLNQQLALSNPQGLAIVSLAT